VQVRHRDPTDLAGSRYAIVVLLMASASPDVARSLDGLRTELLEASVPVASVSSVDAFCQRSAEHGGDLVGAIVVGMSEPELCREEMSKLLAVRDTEWPDAPLFVLADTAQAGAVPDAWLDAIDGLMSIGAEVPGAVRDRILTAAAEYRDMSVPPFFRALRNYTRRARFAWHTPGHLAGEALLKHPAGRALHAFYGSSLLRADIGSSVADVGSVLEHEGAVRDAEEEAAEIFHADRSYFVTNGTTMSNQIVLRSLVKRGDAVLVDRNCHKSVLNALIMTGGIPVFMLPNRNGQGLIGPLQARELEPEAIRERIRSHPLLPDGARPVAAVITNSTYDGSMYRIGRAIAKLGESTDAVLADEAWISYAPFHPLLHVGSAMRATEGVGERGPTVFSTTSLHKTLTALSQGSLINVRDGRRPVPNDRFNEAFLLHASTSPQYAILASLDVAARMMDGAVGERLVEAAVTEAVQFRQALTRWAEEKARANEWSFRVWQPDRLPLDEPPSRLTRDLSLWSLQPGAAWHGFRDIPDDEYALLDPTKVSVLTPGVDAQGRCEAQGIPAPLVARWLREHGVVAEKVGFYSLLFLFTIGVNPGQSESLHAELRHFKRDYDANRLVEDVMPELYEEFPARYRGVHLTDLAREMHGLLAGPRMPDLLQQVCASLPEAAMSPTDAFEHLVDGAVDPVPLDELEHRTTAVLCVVYPPGIPLVVPGERFDNPSGRAVIACLKVFEAWERAFPGFENEVQGVVRKGGGTDVRYAMYCVR
jgi:arginine decarboxylase